MGEVRPSRWLYLSGRATIGRSLFYDEVDPFLGRSRSYYGEIGLQPSPRLNQSVTYNREEFDRIRDRSRVYTVNVINSKTTFQINRFLFLRGIVQWDSSREEILTDFLASWELLPGTVAYAGYGSLVERQDWDGASFVPQAGRYRVTERGLFFKASYVHRF
jgi:hypothetical protein